MLRVWSEMYLMFFSNAIVAAPVSTTLITK